MIAYMKNLGYKCYLQFVHPIAKKPINYVSSFFAILGGCFSICEIEQAVLQTQTILAFFRQNLPLVLLLIALAVILIHMEKSEHTAYFGKMDIIISLKIGNLLNTKESAIVIPTNTTFDTTMNGDFISIRSIQGQFQRKRYGVDFKQLDSAISTSLDECYPNDFEVLTDRKKTNCKRYEIGTVAKVTNNGHRYYFLAVSDVSPTGKPQNVTIQNLTKALVGLWDYLSMEGHSEAITIPVIGTGRAGLKDGTFEDIIHESIFSFATKIQDEFVAKKMTVCLYPTSLSDANVSWDSLCNYLDWQCKFFSENRNRVENATLSGNPVEIS